jgi:hypothetical protein
LSVAISGGTRRRNTVGFSSRSIWSSNSTYKSDQIAALPERPSNGRAYALVFLGICGLLLAFFIGSSANDEEGVALVTGVIGGLLVLGGIRMRVTTDRLATAQANWDNCWVCARCGHQWQSA